MPANLNSRNSPPAPTLRAITISEARTPIQAEGGAAKTGPLAMVISLSGAAQHASDATQALTTLIDQISRALARQIATGVSAYLMVELSKMVADASTTVAIPTAQEVISRVQLPRKSPNDPTTRYGQLPEKKTNSVRINLHDRQF